MYGEKIPYPKSGMQPSSQGNLNQPNGGPSKISGVVNDIYLPPVSKVATTSIYLTNPQKLGGGANDIENPNPSKVVGGANKNIYLADNKPV